MAFTGTWEARHGALVPPSSAAEKPHYGAAFVFAPNADCVPLPDVPGYLLSSSSVLHALRVGEVPCGVSAPGHGAHLPSFCVRQVLHLLRPRRRPLRLPRAFRSPFWVRVVHSFPRILAGCRLHISFGGEVLEVRADGSSIGAWMPSNKR
uniref:Uncharacterized protein n=1 Tax=Oryza glumipatula TaxID=40148 RepID=A0A0E0B4T1_9ORYZ